MSSNGATEHVSLPVKIVRGPNLTLEIEASVRKWEEKHGKIKNRTEGVEVANKRRSKPQSFANFQYPVDRSSNQDGVELPKSGKPSTEPRKQLRR